MNDDDMQIGREVAGLTGSSYFAEAPSSSFVGV